jgi:dihydroorotate dehydrogenase
MIRSSPPPCGAAASPTRSGSRPGSTRTARRPTRCSGWASASSRSAAVTPKPQPGSPRPRLFRLAEDEAVINRYGLNSLGLDALVARLEARPPGGVVGINLGKNKDSADEVSDFALGIRATAALAGYLVVNVSSPNTPGLRDLQARASLERVMTAALAARDEAGGPAPPLLVKLAPDLDDEALRDVAEVALATGIDGLVMGNTTVARPSSLRSAHRAQTGGLSGRPLRDLATERLHTLYRLTGGVIPLVGCGGVASGADAYAKIRAGASLVQLYSALVFGGPGLVTSIKRDLAAHLRRHGFATVAEAVGAEHRRHGMSKMQQSSIDAPARPA